MIESVSVHRGSSTAFAQGATVVRRDVLRGKVWSAAPQRVLADDDDGLLLAYWPGVEMLASTTWITWLTTGDDGVRKQGLRDLAGGQWQLDPWVWRDTSVLAWFGVDPDFSIHRFFDADGAPLRWYVNFERPFERTPIGINTFDLMLDLVAAPDLSHWWWKDEDEYALGRSLGFIDDADHRRIGQARERAVALIEKRQGPFSADWSRWPGTQEWPLPLLPATALDVTAS